MITWALAWMVVEGTSIPVVMFVLAFMADVGMVVGSVAAASYYFSGAWKNER